ncbi:MAG TPA: hypothetical protein ENJ41_07945 [Oceanospirillales bacterium]|nr:hypothetical protein [Oceanospirillales bacterium]
MKNLKSLILLLLIINLLACSSTPTSPNQVDDKAELDQLSTADNHRLTVGEYLILREYKLPIPSIGTERRHISRQLGDTKARIIRSDARVLALHVRKRDKETRKKTVLFKVSYYFKNNRLIKGPTITVPN